MADEADPNATLKWVRSEDEKTIREAFEKTMKVRSMGGDAKDLADKYFFETLVRVHRAGEGAPYTGLKDEAPEPIIKAADSAIATGSDKALVDILSRHTAQGVNERFEKVKSAAVEKDKSTEAGREYVEAYVNFTHYLEGLHTAAMGTKDAHGQDAHEHSAEASKADHGE